MEKTLSKLFDYQKFAENRRLQDVIDAVHKRPRALSLEEADLVAAAGSPYHKSTPSDDEDQAGHR